MKLHFFHLMPWPDLPDDFQQSYRSVWVDVPSKLYDSARGHEVYNDYLDELEYAASAGFDGICVNEHHSNAYGLMPSPNIMAAALARRTQDAGLVVMGNSIALYNPPIRVAEEFAMLDVISGGRLVAGFPVGSSMDTNFAYGQVPITLREKYQEAHDLIIRAWTDPDVFAWNGKYTKLRYVNTWPKPIQKPHPPIWIPGGGSIETWGWATERDYLYAYLSYFGYKRAKSAMDGFWNEVDRHGRERNPYRAGFLQFVGVSETDAQAEADYSEAADYFYNRCLHVAPGFADAPGYRTRESVKAGMVAQVGQSAAQQRAGLKWKDFIEQGYVVAGSPETVRQQLEEVAKGLNVGHLMLLLHFGNMSKEQVLKNTALFSREVMPHLKPLFGEWEDKWWINPLPASGRVEPAPIRTGAATGVK
jgi:alkanesulfonate monooxygenase SsuD/methylene tetrahydromethanopterin reductase-like flavin-dependent oxidoreductase (luciferase family)